MHHSVASSRRRADRSDRIGHGPGADPGGEICRAGGTRQLHEDPGDRRISPTLPGLRGPLEQRLGAAVAQDLRRAAAQAVGIIARAAERRRRRVRGHRDRTPRRRSPARGDRDCSAIALSSSSTSRAQAAMGMMQPPSSSASAARSARTARWVAGSSSGSRIARTAASSRRHSIPSAPWPTAGRNSGGSSRWVTCPSRPSRLSPAQASTTASSRPSSAWFSRVSTFPRSVTTSRSGRRYRSCARRRGELVPTRAGRQGVERPVTRRDQGVGNVLAHRHRRQGQPGRPLRGQVLQAVHRHVDRPVADRPLDLLGEQPRPAGGHGRQRRVAVAVPLRLDLDQLDVQARMQAPQPVGHPLRLPARQAAPAGADADRARCGRHHSIHPGGPVLEPPSVYRLALHPAHRSRRSRHRSDTTALPSLRQLW